MFLLAISACELADIRDRMCYDHILGRLGGLHSLHKSIGDLTYGLSCSHLVGPYTMPSKDLSVPFSILRLVIQLIDRHPLVDFCM